MMGCRLEWTGLAVEWIIDCLLQNKYTLIAASRNSLKYDDVYSQSSDTNTTVYCGGIQSDLTGGSFLIISFKVYVVNCWRLCNQFGGVA